MERFQIKAPTVTPYYADAYNYGPGTKKEPQQCSHRPWIPNKRRERARELVSSNLGTFTDYLRTFEK